MQELQIFNSSHFGQLRTFWKDGACWFVAADVCSCLLIKNSRQATYRLDDDEKGAVLISTPGGNQTVTAVNEEGLYALVLSSRKREAKEFKRWVTHEVIPTIRKTGSYSLAGTNQQTMLQSNDVKAIAKMVAKELKAQQAKEVKALLPKGNCIYVSTADYEALQYIRETVHWMERLERKDYFSVVRDFVRALVL